MQLAAMFVFFDVHCPLSCCLRCSPSTLFHPESSSQFSTQTAHTIGTYYTCAKSHFAKIPKHCKTKSNYLLITSHLKVLHSSILTILLITVNL